MIRVYTYRERPLTFFVARFADDQEGTARTVAAFALLSADEARTIATALLAHVNGWHDLPVLERADRAGAPEAEL